jgi:oligopeptide transport system substrate-binding protein
MAKREKIHADPMSRAAVRQMLWLGAAGTAAFIALMAALSWAGSLTGGGATATKAYDFETQTITTSIRSEPPQLDSTRQQDTTSDMIIGHVIEGLGRYDDKNGIAPGVAEHWEIGTDEATFWLREDSLWSDGKPVTAHDFVFAWRTVVDPATASEYAFIAYIIKNGEAINNGELPPSELGAYAVSDRVLKVEFENPIAYFEKLIAFSTFAPIREDFYRSRNGRYAADADDLLYNGPFRITRWVHGASLRMEKNPTYWNRDAIKLNAIDIAYITTDANARLNLFADGRVADVDHIPGEALEQALQNRWHLGRFADGSVWYLEVNQRPDRPVGRNLHFRKALQLANDPGELVNKVLGMPSYTVAESLFPAFIAGAEGLFRDEYPPPTIQPDPAAAREHLEMARRELGLEEFPPLVLLSQDTPAAVKHSEYLQDKLRRVLGLDVRVDRQIFKQYLDKANDGEFDILISGWNPDFNDPMTFADLFTTWNDNNRGHYENLALDRKVRAAQQSLDPRTRMAAFGEIQRILFEDAAIILNYDRGVMYVQDPHLKGVIRRAVGPEPDYTHAYVVENP